MMDEQNDPKGIQEDESGWKLYYSEEGYPYYFNEITGDSRWAEYDENSTYPYDESQYYQGGANDQEYQQHTQSDYSYSHNNFPSNSNSVDLEAIELRAKRGSPTRQSQPSYFPNRGEIEQDDEEDEGDDDDSEESTEDEAEMDRKFKEYLRTPEGIAAVLYEQERIERQIQKQQEKQSIQQDAEYVRNLMISKKEDDGGRDGNTSQKSRVIKRPLNVFESIREGFNVYIKGMIDPAERAQKKENKLKKKVEMKDQEENQQRKSRTRRKLLDKSAATYSENKVVEEEDEDEEIGVSKESRSSSSSDLVSLSSEDSDIAVINAPMFSEVTPFLNRFYTSYIEPTREYLDRSGITENTTVAANYMLIGGRYVVYHVASATYTLTTGLISLGGSLLQNGLTATGQQLYPHLVTFMENVIDGGNQLTEISGSTGNEQSSSEEKTGDIHFTASSQTKEENTYDVEAPVIDAEDLHPTVPSPPKEPAAVVEMSVTVSEEMVQDQKEKESSTEEKTETV